MTHPFSSPSPVAPGDPNDADAGDFLRVFSETRGYLLGRPARAVLTPAADAVVFLRSPAQSPEQDLYELDLASGTTRRLLCAADLLAGGNEAITAEEQARRERQRIVDRGFTAFALTPNGASIVLAFSGRLFVVERRTSAARAVTAADSGAPLDPRICPKGLRVAYVCAGNVYVASLTAPADARPVPPPVAITAGADANRFFGLAEFVAQEEMGRFEGMWWSPDGTHLAFTEVDQSDVEQFSIADPARPERAPQVFAYPRPGRSNARVGLKIAAMAATDPARAAPAAPAASPALGPAVTVPAVTVVWDRDRYPYLARVVWDAPGLAPAILVQTRDQRDVALLAVDVATGATQAILVEHDAAWVNLERDLPRGLPDGSGFLWASEGQGSRALQVRRPDGTLRRELVGPGAGFLSVVHVTNPVPRDSSLATPSGLAVFALFGDALTSRLERIDVASGVRTRIIDDDGCDRSATVARDGGCVLETRVGPRLLPDTRVVFGDGRIVAVPAVAPAPPFRVNLQLTRSGGDPDCAAAIIRPRDFAANQRYPVILHVYGGPHSLMVRADERHYLLDQWMADQGAVVVAIDNRGTPRRDRSWERDIKGRFGDVPLDDQIAALHALAARHAELDLTRVGVYGWSYGGFLAALAVLRRPDVFKAAVAGAPVVDWLDYDTHYTERYLDLPDQAPDAYRAASLLTYAADLCRPLLLIHGTADDNVYFFHSLKLADALVRAGRPFEFLPLARVTHQLADPVMRQAVWRRVAAFLLRELKRLPADAT